MSMQDPIADMLTSIRNAQLMGIQKIHALHSNFKCEVLNVLKEEGFINDFKVLDDDKKKSVEIFLKYYQGQPVIEKINRVSRPALRVYRGSSNLPIVRGGLGIAIISTPKGIMTDKKARALGIGGEVLCTVE